ncbi:MAG: hypothetical protein ACR2RB_04165, partial [Gammaproteobacteria bacterium]
VVHQTVKVVLVCKPANKFLLMLPTTFYQIACYADVQGAMPFVGKNVDAGLFFHSETHLYQATIRRVIWMSGNWIPDKCCALSGMTSCL